jgi:molybdopterin-containing oxidoreductase family membrane subunit
MIEKALIGSNRYYAAVFVLLAIIGVGFFSFLHQFEHGLVVTGLSRDVPWGFYIAQLTFLVGVAASAVMVVLPYYLHDFKEFGKLAILGEFLAIPAVVMCMLFVWVDMGQPMRLTNVFLHPTPNSVMFWDASVLMGYLLLNIVISQVTFGAERKGVKPPNWIKPIILLSIPWAVSIHTVTAFLYAGLAARPFWMTAILAPRFLASAFAAGPAILILLCLIVRSVSDFDPGEKAISKLGEIVAYAMVANVFFILLEVFTAAYSAIPEHLHHFQYMYIGISNESGDYSVLAPWMWLSSALAVVSLILLLVPRYRRSVLGLAVACVAVIGSLWIDKGMSMVVTGFIPNPLGEITEYIPTLPELGISAGIYALGALILLVLYKVAISVREGLQA